MKNIIFLLSILFLFTACEKDNANNETEEIDLRTAGDGSIFSSSQKAFSFPINGLSEEQQNMHDAGDELFESKFSSSSSPIRPGLGPLYNNTSCNACHPDDGRAQFPTNLNQPSGFFLRISSGNDSIKGPIPTPGYGLQLQQVANFGYQPECRFNVYYTTKEVELNGGTIVKLQKPAYSISQLYTPIQGEYQLSPRLAMPVIGLGLLEAIPEEEILSHADPDDRNRDGISGRPNYVWNTSENKTSLGRFGWKANTATVLEQCAAALASDMGLSNPVHPLEGFANQTNGKDPLRPAGKTDVSQYQLDILTFYCRTLAVPMRRNVNNPMVQRGEKLFTQIGCALCHLPTMTTGKCDIKQLSNQTIHAYTDMLLHDMGEDLADHRKDFLANGKEWKTRPLWGIGLTQTVNSHENLLHDGRAKSITEAILWHGGEAQSAQNKFRELTPKDRDALISFLRSL